MPAPGCQLLYCTFQGFGSEGDQESPSRERPENRASQAASSQKRPPDKRPAQFRGAAAAGAQSSRGRKQGPEGTPDDPPREGEVSRLPRQGEALRLPLAAPRSSHPPAPPEGAESFPAPRPPWDHQGRAAPACPEPKVTALVWLTTDTRIEQDRQPPK
ncbi:salivary acidic proline-rich phosphoprotein 1/2-like isoform X2 [Cervus elaphus]|uniref:salivary acidic proline-rich phosphoprotein 1/2-like isoform X2 n=1 Tax=Cervus elaphus TaxID=9860 RepID=UPI001CC27823|nr:salivary acidic proline-rich phosphoprotein 1/2-like isoform X2 [Cervus elaphus]